MSAVPEPSDERVPAEQPSRAEHSQLAALLKTARPKQWIKNILVFAAPAAAGVLTEADALVKTLVAFVAFCLAASATYLLNDAADVEADRMHPTKRTRPIAAGGRPASVKRMPGRSFACVASPRKCRANTGTSSRRARMGGRWSGKTFSRSNRSAARR